jgi:hypothetical protein
MGCMQVGSLLVEGRQYTNTYIYECIVWHKIQKVEVRLIRSFCKTDGII